MANITTTQVTVISTPEMIEWLEKELKEIGNIEDSGERDLKFIETFGVEGENITEKVGAKWLIFDSGTVEKKDEDRLFFQLESANHLPDTLLINLQNMIKNKSEELTGERDWDTSVEGRYWDEAFQPIGVFSVYGDEIATDEAHLDEIDYDDEDYWDNQVEPEFDKLEV